MRIMQVFSLQFTEVVPSVLSVLLQVAVTEVHHASSICCLRFTECSNKMQQVEKQTLCAWLCSSRVGLLKAESVIDAKLWLRDVWKKFKSINQAAGSSIKKKSDRLCFFCNIRNRFKWKQKICRISWRQFYSNFISRIDSADLTEYGVGCPGAEYRQSTDTTGASCAASAVFWSCVAQHLPGWAGSGCSLLSGQKNVEVLD